MGVDCPITILSCRVKPAKDVLFPVGSRATISFRVCETMSRHVCAELSRPPLGKRLSSPLRTLIFLPYLWTTLGPFLLLFSLFLGLKVERKKKKKKAHSFVKGKESEDILRKFIKNPRGKRGLLFQTRPERGRKVVI